jgi:hypothetical protein
MTLSEKIKQALAGIEAVRKDLNAVDEAHAEAKAVGALLDVRRAELAEVEQRLARIKDEAVSADAELSQWRAVAAKEQAAGNARIDELQERLRVLEAKVTERQKEHDAILASMAALGRRLRVG